jgi:hypothetical protein
VLSTTGGSVTTARKIALLLREYAQHLTILVPYRARSAGTLLCLSANELVLGPMAELGPIDSHIGSAGSLPPDAPGMISAEDIRAFRQMAEDWFGVRREEDRLQVLALVAQRIFPTSLSSFYRFDKLVRQVANELLEYQLPEADASTRQRIVDKLVGGYLAHDYVLSRREAQELGLRVRQPSPQEEALLWDLCRAYHPQITEHSEGTEGEVVGLVANTHFFARKMFRRVGTPTRQSDGPQRRRGDKERLERLMPGDDLRHSDALQSEDGVDAHWEIDT